MSATISQKAPAYPSDDVTLQIAGMNFTGWQDIRIVRGIEVFPSHFALRLTERLPGQPTTLAIDPGQRCKLMIGSDVVMTGFIDTYQSQVSTKGHEISVIGRSATEDLVDCAAGVTSGQETKARMTFSSPNLFQLAQDLCKPFGITVTEPDGEGTPLVSLGDGIPQFTIPIGQSVYEVLEPIARWRQMLLLDGTDGSLILAKVGTKKAASGFTLPGSVIEATIGFRKQDRYSVYLPVQFAFDSAFDVSAALKMDSQNYHTPVPDAAAFQGQPRWDGQDRYRPHFVQSTQNLDTIYLCEQVAKWEKARRYGRSQAVSATVALWRDSAGALWTPNTLAQVDMPSLKVANRTWLISEVMFLKGFGTGTRTTVTLMPPEAFQPEPTFYTPFDPQVAAAQAEALKARQQQAGSVTYDSRPVSVTQGAGV